MNIIMTALPNSCIIRISSAGETSTEHFNHVLVNTGSYFGRRRKKGTTKLYKIQRPENLYRGRGLD